MQEHGPSATAAANISTPSACPWHQFWEGVIDPTSWQAALPSARRYAADHVLHTTAVAAVAVPVLGMLSQRQGRQILFQAADTAVATVLLILLLGVVLGLPTAAAYLLWVAAKTVVSYPLAWFS